MIIEATHSKKYKDITLWLSHMDLKDSCYSSMEIVSFGLWCIVYINWVSATRN
jgi:hypothetical protein